METPQHIPPLKLPPKPVVPLLPNERAALEPPPRPHVWVWLVVAAVVIGVVVWQWPRIKGLFGSTESAASQHRGGGATPVVAVEARRGDMPIYDTGLGTVTPLATVSVHTRIDGQIQQIMFDEGQHVNQGDLLIQIDPRPYEQARDQAIAQRDKDQAALANAQVDLQRDIAAAEAIPQQVRDTQQALVDQDAATIEVDNATVNNALLNLQYTSITAPISGTIGLRSVDIGNMVHASDATGMATITVLDPITILFFLPQDNLPQIQRAMKIAATQPSVLPPELQSKLASVTAAWASTPATGLAGASPGHAGTHRATTREQTTTRANISPPAAQGSEEKEDRGNPFNRSTSAPAPMPANAAGGVSNGPTVDAIGSSTGLSTILARGMVLAVDNQVDPTTGNVRIKGVFPNTNRALFPGQFVNARMLVDVRKDVVLIPVAGVQYGPNNAAFVYVVKPDKKVEVRQVKVGPKDATDAVIESGVEPGEVVVTEGVDKLTADMTVQVHAPNESATQPAQEGAESRATTQSAPAHLHKSGGHKGQGS